VLRPSARHMIRILVGPKAFGEPLYSREQIEEGKKEFFEVILKQLDAMLKDKEYLCTSVEFSAVDIAFYNEISTVMLLSGFKLKRTQFPNLFAWIGRLADVAEIGNSDDRFLEVLTKYGI